MKKIESDGLLKRTLILLIFMEGWAIFDKFVNETRNRNLLNFKWINIFVFEITWLRVKLKLSL